MSGRRRPKRSDVTTLMLCQAVARYAPYALDMLCRDFPPKVLLAAVHRDSGGQYPYVNWGVSAWRPFLDDKGRRLIASHDASDGDYARLREELHDDPTGLALIDFERCPVITLHGRPLTKEERVDGACMRPGFRKLIAEAWQALQPPVLGEAFGGVKMTIERRS